MALPTSLSQSQASAPRYRSKVRDVALLELAQDVAALLSILIETTLSLLYTWFRRTLSTTSLEPRLKQSGRKAEQGKAVVLLGADQVAGQGLTLQLAKASYTVFPILPLPSPASPPTSPAFSSLLLKWGGIKKRLRAKSGVHTGEVVPVMVDPENTSTLYMKDGTTSGKNRFTHAAHTVRAYCRENALDLVSIICVAKQASYGNTATQNGDVVSQSDSHRAECWDRFNHGFHISPKPWTQGLISSQEDILLRSYRNNISEPLSIIKELSDLLSPSNHQELDQIMAEKNVLYLNLGEGGDAIKIKRNTGRIIFVDISQPWPKVSEFASATKIVRAAKREMVAVLRDELQSRGVGVDVSEVIAGPLSPRFGRKSIRTTNQDHDDKINGTETIHHKGLVLPSVHNCMLDESESVEKHITSYLSHRREQFVQSQVSEVNLIDQILGVDDALLFSAVRRAIQDPFPRNRYHAGLMPLFEGRLGRVLVFGWKVVRWLVSWVW